MVNPDARALLHLVNRSEDRNTVAIHLRRSRWPVCSADGKQIAFNSDKNGQDDLSVKSSSGASGEKLLLSNGFRKIPSDWSSDGNSITASGHLRIVSTVTQDTNGEKALTHAPESGLIYTGNRSSTERINHINP